MTYFKNKRHKILVTLDDDGKRTVFNDGISFVALINFYSELAERCEE